LTTPRFDPATSRRRFRVALSDYAVTSFLPHLMSRLLALAPGISMEVSDMTSAAFSKLEAGDLEFSMQPSSWRLRHEDVPVGVRTTPLFDDEFACAVDCSVHRFDRMTRERYVELPHVVTRLHGWGTTAIADVWNREGIRPRVALVAPGFTSALLALPGTPLVATVQRALIRRLARSLPIAVFDCPLPMDPLHQELYWHSRLEGDPAHRFVREQFVLAGQDVSDATA
ncbi:MAG: hypothetical protein H0X39_20465, partial [Actinobacteria bacterium]|nr:hypothetical protein [Actinomycetota bacterium]